MNEAENIYLLLLKKGFQIESQYSQLSLIKNFYYFYYYLINMQKYQSMHNDSANIVQRDATLGQNVEGIRKYQGEEQEATGNITPLHQHQGTRKSETYQQYTNKQQLQTPSINHNLLSHSLDVKSDISLDVNKPDIRRDHSTVQMSATSISNYDKMSYMSPRKSNTIKDKEGGDNGLVQNQDQHEDEDEVFGEMLQMELIERAEFDFISNLINNKR